MGGILIQVGAGQDCFHDPPFGPIGWPARSKRPLLLVVPLAGFRVQPATGLDHPDPLAVRPDTPFAMPTGPFEFDSSGQLSPVGRVMVAVVGVNRRRTRHNRNRVKPNLSDVGQNVGAGFLGTSSNQRAGALLVLDHQQPAFSARKMQSVSWLVGIRLRSLPSTGQEILRLATMIGMGLRRIRTPVVEKC